MDMIYLEVYVATAGERLWGQTLLIIDGILGFIEQLVTLIPLSPTQSSIGIVALATLGLVAGSRWRSNKRRK